MKSICILIPYFGKFPEWAPLFFETIRRNESIDFKFFTDCETEGFEASNIEFIQMDFNEYVRLVNSKIKIDFNPSGPYKICDLRPLFGFLHQDILKGYDFYGWADTDLLLGDIRNFYADEILSKFDVFSTHQIRISGHFALVRNNSRNRNRYKKIYQWKKHLENPEFVGIDEHGLTNAYTMGFFDKLNEKFNLKINNPLTRKLSALKKRKLYLKEQFTTPFTRIPWLDGTIDSNQPDTWFYKDGKIYNNRDGNKDFIYLHLMNFKSGRWRHDGTRAPWEGKEKICYASKEDMIEGIEINPNGIFKLADS